ncbi:hypothetical protein OIU85_006892 [Salix viminalis]|uniref:Uncharacterized protein n=1 Tax=Salix viminalis TaxID=40686 RepID=A0A9Q0PM31_SALVM|nr:hypothetical protein OIU85_006892 [Salix viminalis]
MDKKNQLMEDFEKKVSLTDTEAMEPEAAASSSSSSSSKSSNTLLLLRRFLETQQRRAQAYAKLKQGFAEYMVSGGELAYQQLCSKITEEFNDCSKQVIEIESLFLKPDHDRDDLADLLRAIQTQEKQKLHLTATIQLLKKAAAGTEEAEADAEYDNALKEAIRGVQDSVTTINEHLEEIKYEIAALEAQ